MLYNVFRGDKMAIDITNKLIRFEDLRKLKNEKQERIYGEELIVE